MYGTHRNPSTPGDAAPRASSPKLALTPVSIDAEHHAVALPAVTVEQFWSGVPAATFYLCGR